MSTVDVYLYVTLVAAIVAGLIAVPWLKREGDRNWARHRQDRVSITLVLDTTKIAAAFGAASVALSKMVPAAIEAERAMKKLAATLKDGPK